MNLQLFAKSNVYYDPNSIVDYLKQNNQDSSMSARKTIAKDLGIKVYTIGVGRNGQAPYPLFDERGREVDTVMLDVEIDEDSLREIAEKTGGEYFRATDKESLKRIYDEINSMEKSKVEVIEFTLVHEEYLKFVLWALALLVTEFFVKYILLKRIP
jgi:Ca-activated chloride channel family protein